MGKGRHSQNVYLVDLGFAKVYDSKAEAKVRWSTQAALVNSAQAMSAHPWTFHGSTGEGLFVVN